MQRLTDAPLDILTEATREKEAYTAVRQGPPPTEKVLVVGTIAVAIAIPNTALLKKPTAYPFRSTTRKHKR